MKKRRVLVLLCIALVLVFSTVLAACNDTKDYKVTFSGDGIETITKTVKDGSTVAAPTDITRVGYDAVWQLDGENFNFATAIHSDITLTLKWVGKNYTVTLNAGGGATEAPTKQVTYGSPFDLGVATTQEEKVFAGWAVNNTAITNSDGAGLDVWNIASDTTVTAIWKDDQSTRGFDFKELEDGTYSVSAKNGFDFIGEIGDIVTIPSKYKNKSVTVVESMRSLSSYEVKIPASIKEIGASAFANNLYVEVVDMSEFSGKIGNMAFYDSEVKIIDLGKTTEIGKQAFKNAPVSIMTIPATVKNLGDEALLSLNLMEIGFVGDFPTLGSNVFGTGERDDDGKITIIADTASWSKLAGMTINEDNLEEANKAISQKTGLAKAIMRHYTAEEIKLSLNGVGILREAGNKNDRAVVYRGIGLSAVIYNYEEANYTEMFEASHVYKYVNHGLSRETYLLNYEDKSVIKLVKNGNGETIYNNTLYDYEGKDVVYYVPEKVTKIAGGVAFGNQTLRYVVTGDDMLEIGPYAFTAGNLFGVVIGANVTKIDDYAFFSQDYIQEVIFYGNTPPTIGEAAFCTISQMGIVPVFIMNGLTQYTGEAAKLYTPLSTYSWKDDPDCKVYLDAFNKSLETLDNLPQIGDVNDPDSMETISYKLEVMRQITTYGINAKGKQYETKYGTLTMTGSDSGFAFITFNDESGFSGSNYAFYSFMNGFDSSSGYRKLQIYTGYNAAGENQSFIVYGVFDDSKYNERGVEAGSYGELDKDTLYFDGFGKFVYYKQDGTIQEGDYTVAGSNITLVGIAGTVVFDAEERKITFNNNDLTALGDEAGVYYDVNNAAKLTVDGKSYTENKVVYSGKLTLEFKGQTVTTGYVINKTDFIFMLNGTEKKWTYSRTSSNGVISGYYGNYEDNLKFKVVENTIVDTFTNGSDTLALDGYFTATINGTKTGFYRMFGESNSVLLIADDQVTIISLNLTDKSYTELTGDETGKWYASTSAKYAWYLDGAGNMLYFSGDEYVSGTYTVDASTKEFAVVYNGSPALNNEKGILDIENGYGIIVYNTGYSNSTAAISKTAFESFKNSWGSQNAYVSAYSFLAGKNSEGEIQTTSPGFNFYKSGNNVFINTYGEAWVRVECNGALAGQTLEFEYTVKKMTATFTAVFTENDGVVTASVLPKDYYTAEDTVKSKDGTKAYNVSWVDATHVVIWSMGNYGGDVLAKGKIVGDVTSEFTVDGYKVTGYGTADAVVEEIAKA